MGKDTIKKPAFLFTAAILFLISLSSFASDVLLMDTYVEITIKDKRADSGELEQGAENLMKRLEKKFNYHDRESELSRINRMSPGEAFSVSEEMHEVLVLAKKINQKTRGAFDISLGTGAWHIDAGAREIAFDTEHVNLNLSGIAKGFIVDEGVKFLVERGVKNAMISAGGDLYCLGDSGREGSGWNIGIHDPLDPGKIIASFTARNKGVATSGSYERPGHIIDPVTGDAAGKKTESATVVSKSCATSDALATALYILGQKEGFSIVEADSDVECFIVDDGGGTHASSGFKLNLTKPKR